jgi:hypothetical protein
VRTVLPGPCVHRPPRADRGGRRGRGRRAVTCRRCARSLAAKTRAVRGCSQESSHDHGGRGSPL